MRKDIDAKHYWSLITEKGEEKEGFRMNPENYFSLSHLKRA